MAKGTTPDGRLLELDALRGLAALAVVLYHYVMIYELSYPSGPAWLDFVHHDAFFTGAVGRAPVYLFFMISGFVIFMTLERCGRLTDFVISRFSRLFPVFWVAVLLSGFLAAVAPLPGQDIGWLQFAANLTMAQEFIGYDNIDPAYWSLTYELAFYAVMAVVFSLLPGRFLGAVLIGALLAELAFIWAAVNGVISGSNGWPVSPVHAHFFIAGIIFYRVLTAQAGRIEMAGLGLVAVLNVMVYPWWLSLPVTLFLPLFWFAVSGRLPWLRHPALVRLGGISYALYVLHQIPGYRLIMWLDTAGVARIPAIVIALAAAFALATLATALVERPAQRAIRGLYRRRQAGKEAPAASVLPAE